MHNTKVIMKDGRVFNAPILRFRPENNPSWMVLMGHSEILYIKDMESAITEGERGDSGDEIARAKKYMKDARKYKWHDNLEIQEWE